MTLSNLLVDLAKKGYEVQFMLDDIAHGMKIRIQKSIYRYEEFIGFEALDCAMSGVDFVLRYSIDRCVQKIDELLKGETK